MIPATAHFVWFGTSFPYTHVLALRSASRHGGFDRVVLHHADDLSAGPYWSEVTEIPGFEARPLDPRALFERIPDHGADLAALFARLTQPAARANMVRGALLHTEGGVYLDTDTITVRDLTALRTSNGVFFGVEHVVLPAAVARSLNPLVRLKALALDGARDVCRRLPRGWRAFRRMEGAYFEAANNAILASEPSHPFLTDLLKRMVELPDDLRMRRYALGTHLLQTASAAWTGTGVKSCPPRVFYPLGPEISGHWFGRDTARHLDELCPEETHVVHWYASVRTKAIVPRLTPDRLRAEADDSAFCALALRYAM